MKEVQRIIIKVGSSSLVLENGDLNEMFFNKLINTISSSMLLDIRTETTQLILINKIYDLTPSGNRRSMMEVNRRKAKKTNHNNVTTKRHPELRDDFDVHDFESTSSANSNTPALYFKIISLFFFHCKSFSKTFPVF